MASKKRIVTTKRASSSKRAAPKAVKQTKAAKPATKVKPEKKPAAKAIGKRAKPDEQVAVEVAKPEDSAPVPAQAAPAAKRRRVQAAPAALKPAPPVNADRQALDLFPFGTNSFGALGLGDPELADDPDARSQIPRPKQPVSETQQYVQVACGGMHTVALTREGDIYTWGVNDEGALGRKTSGTCWEKEPDTAKGDSFTPGLALLPNGLKAMQIAAGDGMTFAIGTDSCLYGCGHFKDEIGLLSGFTPDTKMQGLFMLIWKPESTRDRIKKITCGARHAAFLTHRGEVYTWGAGSQGQLGRIQLYAQDSDYQATVAELFTPSPVPLGAMFNVTPVADIDCGAYSTYAVSRHGEVAAWGLNNSSQLGIAKEGNNDNIAWSPRLVQSLQHVVAIKGGEQHALALTKEGKLLSFGAATYGMLGRADVNTNTADELHPEPKPVDGLEGLRVTQIAAGTNVSACVTADGDAYFWGSNTNLQLAKGTDEDDEKVPKKMGRVKVFGYRKIQFVCFGGQHGALLAGAAGEAPPPAAAAPAARAPAADGAGTSAVPAAAE